MPEVFCVGSCSCVGVGPCAGGVSCVNGGSWFGCGVCVFYDCVDAKYLFFFFKYVFLYLDNFRHYVLYFYSILLGYFYSNVCVFKNH